MQACECRARLASQGCWHHPARVTSPSPSASAAHASRAHRQPAAEHPASGPHARHQACRRGARTARRSILSPSAATFFPACYPCAAPEAAAAAAGAELAAKGLGPGPNWAARHGLSNARGHSLTGAGSPACLEDAPSAAFACFAAATSGLWGAAVQPACLAGSAACGALAGTSRCGACPDPCRTCACESETCISQPEKLHTSFQLLTGGPGLERASLLSHKGRQG